MLSLKVNGNTHLMRDSLTKLRLEMKHTLRPYIMPYKRLAVSLNKHCCLRRWAAR